MRSLYKEAKVIFPQVDSIPVPVIKKFSDEVDQMLYDFKEVKGSSILIQKLSQNNYIFGTKKIYAKVSNGVLLIRVGGGFMDIENFYNTYGEIELVRQERDEIKKKNKAAAATVEIENLASDGAPLKLMKNVLVNKFKKNKGVIENQSRTQNIFQGGLTIEQDTYYTENTPGEYEITLADDEE